MTLSLSSEPQARTLYRPRITQKEMNPMRVKGMSSYIRVREVRDQVPETTYVMEHAPTVRSTTQAMSYIERPREWRSTSAPNRSPETAEVPRCRTRRQSLAPQCIT